MECDETEDIDEDEDDDYDDYDFDEYDDDEEIDPDIDGQTRIDYHSLRM